MAIIHIDDNRPDNYWMGDTGYIYYIDGYGSLPYGIGGYGGTEVQYDGGSITSPMIVEFIVISSTATSLTLFEDLEFGVPEDTPILMKKDNFKKDSFQYKKKPDSEKINQIHLEYIRREPPIKLASIGCNWTFDTYPYITDILDYQDEYNINLTGEIRELSISMHGIKRNTQARRMISFLGDFNSIIEWSCNFDTDIVGMFLCIGNIVGVTNEILDWNAKLFRIVGMEELEDYEIKLDLLEYIPSIYNDYSIAYIPNTVNNYYKDIFEIPDQVINLRAIEYSELNKIYLGFSKPVKHNTWWIGAVIYHYSPNTLLWEKLGTSYWNTFTSTLSSSINDTQTIIPFSTTYYDIDKLQNSGIIWIEKEMIYYDGIDEVNHYFLNCERGFNDTIAIAHSSETCIYLRDNLYYYTFDVINDVGKTHIFKAVSITSYGIMADGDTAPTVSIFIDGNFILPYPVSLLKIRLI